MYTLARAKLFFVGGAGHKTMHTHTRLGGGGGEPLPCIINCVKYIKFQTTIITNRRVPQCLKIIDDAE